MRRLFLVAVAVSALLFAAWGSGARSALADGAAGGQLYLVNANQSATFKGEVHGLPPSMPLFLAYNQVGTNTWVQMEDGSFWTGADGSTGFWFTPNTDFMAPVQNGSYKIEACADTTCVVFDISIGEQTVIFQSSVSTNPCLYAPTYNPALGGGGPSVQFSGNITLPPYLAYWQALQCGFPAWTYNWAPMDFINYYGFDYYDPSLWAPWVWGGYPYSTGLTIIGYPGYGYTNPNFVPGYPTAPGYWPGYGYVTSGTYPAVQYNQGVMQILGTSLQTPVTPWGQAIPIFPWTGYQPYP